MVRLILPYPSHLVEFAHKQMQALLEPTNQASSDYFH